MLVPVVRIGKMLMRMRQWLMTVPMSMYRSWCNGLIMGMLMMFVMRMLMFVFQGLMRVDVAVVLGQMQPDPERHQDTGHEQRCGDWLPRAMANMAPKNGATEK